MIPKKVLKSFGFDKVISQKQLTIGLIHQTYLIKNGQSKYIIQRLHPVLATPEIAQGFLFVTNYLHQQNFLAPECVLSKKGDVLVNDGKWNWRVQTYISGKTISKVERSGIAGESGRIYADFHRVMSGCSYKFKSKKVLHDTEAVYSTFKKTVEQFSDSELMVPALEQVNFLLKMTPKFFLSKKLPMRVIHGDPKISNILFDLSGKAKALVDLDTCNRRPIAVELGDAFRSWCGKAEDSSKNTFSIPMFRSAWKGYSENAIPFSKLESLSIAKGIGTITLELACRFLTDYFLDSYFGWDSSRYPSRRAHNLARVNGQIAEFLDYQKKRQIIEKIILNTLDTQVK